MRGTPERISDWGSLGPAIPQERKLGPLDEHFARRKARDLQEAHRTGDSGITEGPDGKLSTTTHNTAQVEAEAAKRARQAEQAAQERAADAPLQNWKYWTEAATGRRWVAFEAQVQAEQQLRAAYHDGERRDETLFGWMRSGMSPQAAAKQKLEDLKNQRMQILLRLAQLNIAPRIIYDPAEVEPQWDEKMLAEIAAKPVQTNMIRRVDIDVSEPTAD